MHVSSEVLEVAAETQEAPQFACSLQRLKTAAWQMEAVQAAPHQVGPEGVEML